MSCSLYNHPQSLENCSYNVHMRTNFNCSRQAPTAIFAEEEIRESLLAGKAVGLINAALRCL